VKIPSIDFGVARPRNLLGSTSPSSSTVLWFPLVPAPGASWQQTLLASWPPRRFSTIRRFWEILRGIILWTLWLASNDKVFNQDTWSSDRIEQVIWNSLLDYGRSAWINMVTRLTSLTKDLTSWRKVLEKFDQEGRSTINRENKEICIWEMGVIFWEILCRWRRRNHEECKWFQKFWPNTYFSRNSQSTK
jgi:hypothetical protein